MGIVYATASKLLVSLLIATALVAFQFVACKVCSLLVIGTVYLLY
jgi:hypothetical protein